MNQFHSIRSCFSLFCCLERWINKKRGTGLMIALSLAVTSVLPSNIFMYGVVNWNNWSASSKKKSMSTPWLVIKLPQLWLSFLFQSHQSESRNFMELVTRKLPNVIRSFTHNSWKQIDRQVKENWGSEWCSPCSPSGGSASASRIYHLLQPTTCHHTTLEWHLSCEHSFLSD